MARKLITRSVASQNQFTDGVTLHGYFNLSISGTWSATVTLQRSFNSGSTWFDVGARTQNIEEYGLEPEDSVQYRVGVKSGDFTSGTVVLRLSQ